MERMEKKNICQETVAKCAVKGVRRVHPGTELTDTDRSFLLSLIRETRLKKNKHSS